MSDLISRTGAIAHFDKVAEELDEQRGDDSWVGNAFKICLLGVVNDLAVLPSAEPQWIPVSERLPENSGCVLISIAGDIEFGAYDKQNSDWAIWRDGYWDEGKRADAWMPLPEPYREDGEE